MNKSFFYITTLAFDNVFRTQVISWLNLYKKHNINFTLVKLFIFRGRFNPKNQEVTDEISELYNGEVSTSYFLPSKYGIFQLLNAFLILVLVKNSFFTRSKSIIQTRNPDLFLPFKLLKKMSPSKFFIIYDCRAAGAEEFKYKKSLNNSDTNTNNVYNRILKHEVNMVKLADKVFTVSNNLKNYFQNKADCLEDKFFIYPCNADSEVFYFNTTERKKIREKLEIREKIVLCYSGGMDLPWHLPKETLSFFNRLYLQNQNYFLILLTNDIVEAESLLNELKIPTSSYFLASVQNVEVRKYLSASDFGLLFRDDVPMNNVASPTKFAEYIMCGLPAIISKGVGDFSKFVVDNNTGIHIPDLRKVNMNVIDMELQRFLKFVNKESIAQIGMLNFSKQALLPLVLKQYSEI